MNGMDLVCHIRNPLVSHAFFGGGGERTYVDLLGGEAPFCKRSEQVAGAKPPSLLQGLG